MRDYDLNDSDDLSTKLKNHIRNDISSVLATKIRNQN